ncbi:hypothetical protein [Leisingera caerulea]|uniref:hypothetical protein n=1 Tax=Leisingera caerulea TaxID=506591 RepID=UPI003F4AEC98
MHYTISGPDIRAVLGVSPQTLVRWFKNHPDGHPPHITDKKVIFYRLDDVVARLRGGNGSSADTGPKSVRPRGLYGDELASLVQIDAERRLEAMRDDMYCEGRSPLLNVLTDAENERLAEMRAAFRYTAVACGFSPDLYMDRLPRHPAIIRYVLTGDRAELPTLEGWASWSRAFCIVNVPTPSDLEKVAA